LEKADTALQEHQSLADYVKKKDGYGLSQEDFTTALKDKLSGLENYDDAEVQAAIEALGKQISAVEAKAQKYTDDAIESAITKTLNTEV
jgi:hypothetical protein